MILIGEAGGTKTDWRYIDQNGIITQYVSEGYNPFYHKIPQLESSVQKVLPLTPSAIYYYAAGVVSEIVQKEIIDFFKSKFEGSQKIEVNSDLLGAARSLYETGAGFVGILGTGSAGFYFDGQNITSRIASLGSLLGNEGSGTDIGKHFVKGLLRNRFGYKTMQSVLNKYPWFSENEVLDRLYQKSTFDFSPFSLTMHACLDDPEVWSTVYSRFQLYLKEFFSDKPNELVRFSGSVAFHYQDILLDACRDFGLTCDRIIQSPIAGLTLYHQKNG